MPRGRPVKYKSSLEFYSVENLLKRKGLDVKIKRSKVPQPIRNSANGRSDNASELRSLNKIKRKR